MWDCLVFSIQENALSQSASPIFHTADAAGTFVNGKNRANHVSANHFHSRRAKLKIQVAHFS